MKRINISEETKQKLKYYYINTQKEIYESDSENEDDTYIESTSIDYDAAIDYLFTNEKTYKTLLEKTYENI